MLDIQFIRDNPDLVKQKSKEKSFEVNIDRLLEVDKIRCDLMNRKDEALRKKNERQSSISHSASVSPSASLSPSASPSPEEIDANFINEGRDNKKVLADIEAKLKPIEDEYRKLLKAVPNMPTEDTPVGASEADNKVDLEWGEKPKFKAPKSHWEIAETKGWIDKERASKVSGSRFAYLKGDFALLSNSLMRYGIDVLTDEAKLKQIAKKANLEVSTKPFTFVLPPLMIREEMFDAMDRLEPREDRYHIEGTDLWLQGSAEHVLGSMHFDEVLAEADLPIRYVGLATSFRQEAGTYGKDTEGIARLHQFEKLEMESLSTPETSLNEHLFMIAIQEYLMQSIGLPYRKLLKCTYDIGKPNARGVDIEVWLPSQEKYLETHTADYMTDYQSRRLKTRFKSADGSLQLVHINDATAFAQRPLIGILENFQTEDGEVDIPEVLVPYMGGKTQI